MEKKKAPRVRVRRKILMEKKKSTKSAGAENKVLNQTMGGNQYGYKSIADYLNQGKTEHEIRKYLQTKESIPRVVYVVVSGPIGYRHIRYFEDAQSALETVMGITMSSDNIIQLGTERTFAGEVPIYVDENGDIVIDFEGMSPITAPYINEYDNITVSRVVEEMGTDVEAVELYEYPGFGEPTVFNIQKDIIDFWRKDEESGLMGWSDLADEKVMDFAIMDQSTYNQHVFYDMRTIAQHGGVDFASKYGKADAKVLVVII